MKLTRFMRPGLMVLLLTYCSSCSDDDPTTPTDTTAPAAVSDLRVSATSGSMVTLAWTAPGDDGHTGTAAQYDVRFGDDPISSANWAACTPATAEPTPATAGTAQSMTLESGSDHDLHFALKTADEVPNWSALSNDVLAELGSGNTFVVRQLTTEGQHDHPCVSEGVVAWIGCETLQDQELYAANLGVAYPAPTPLTDNGGEKGHPNNHGTERIVWEGRTGPGADWEIWIYDHNATPRFHQFTDNEVHDRSPDLAGAGNFAWLQDAPHFSEVHYWNESAHSESVLSDVCCPAASWNTEFISASDGAVLWRSYDQYGGEGPVAYLWDGVLTDLTGTLEANLTSDYSLFEGTVAFRRGTSPPPIKYWDGLTVVDVGEGYSPSLHDGSIAYEAWDGHDWEIYYWDGNTVHEITNNDFNDTQPSLDGTFIAWIGRPEGGASADHIFYTKVVE